MSLKSSIPMVLISGFLGSGKTTFLNNLFDSLQDRKFGIIINDFGALGVDAAEIKKTPGSLVSELNNGQIFCSCLSGSFLNSVSAYSDKDIDYLLVETSGLAKPSPLMDIIEGIKKINGDRFKYHGMISLVDCSTYLKLSGVLKAVDEQIQYSDLILINKTDLADPETLGKTEAKIMSLNPDAGILRTQFGKMPLKSFLGLKEQAVLPGPDRLYAGWDGNGRPVPLVMKSSHPVSMEKLREFIEEPGGEYYRMKGRLSTDRGNVYVDYTMSSGNLREGMDKDGADEGLVIILPADNNIVDAVKTRASAVFTSVA